jgi:16S rRNA (uracil1498-N3)-methyltransferase
MTPTPVGGPASVRATAHTYADVLDDELRIDGDDGHHLERVRRVRPGEIVTVSDPEGCWRMYEVTATTDAVISLYAHAAAAREPVLVPRLALAVALTKSAAPDLVVQKATELGVDRVVLVDAARSVVRWDATRVAHALARLRRIAREAGAQSRRARVPAIEGPVPAVTLANHPGLVVADVTGVTADALPLPSDGPLPAGEWLVAVGPEGGFAPQELEVFAAAPRLAVGPFVLRAETAAVASLAALAGRRRFEPV